MKKITLLILLLNIFYCAAQDASKITILDTRHANSEPSYYKRVAIFEFKLTSVLGAPGKSYYGSLMTIAPWIDATGNKNHQIFFNDDGIFHRTGVFGQSNWEAWRQIIQENAQGNVGIGTLNPTQKLTVNGTILAKEVLVESGWADFVFNDDYILLPLDEVEKYILKNNHLPEVPTEKETKTNGVNLGEMNVKLLQKIEELTLYLIQHEKDIKELKEENRILKDLLQQKAEGSIR